MKQRAFESTLAIAAGLAGLLAACRPASQPPPEVAPSSEPALVEPVPIEVDSAFGPGTFDMPDARIGLDALQSYTATLVVTFDGTRDGSPLQWTAKYVMIKMADPAGRALSVERSDDIRDQDPTFVAEARGMAYQAAAGQACIGTPLEAGTSLLEEREPAGMLAGVLGAENAGTEAVDGVEAAHYTFDERAIGQNGSTDSAGEMWVASEGGYILRYHLTTTAEAAFFGEGTAGTISWNYELADVNQALGIELPAECPPGLVDAPILSDAANVDSLPGKLEYDTASSVQDAAAFYMKELAPLGWTPSGSAAVPEGMTLEEYQKALDALRGLGPGGSVPGSQPTPNPNEESLAFTQGNRTLIVLITTEAAGTHVRVVLLGD